MICAAALNGYQNARFLLANRMGFPPYVVASTGLLFVCGVGMLCSARLWWLRRVRSATVTLVVSVLAAVLGPVLLLKLLL